MNIDTEAALCGATPCPKGRAWLVETGHGPVAAYNHAPNGAWLAWGCSKRPMTVERLRRLVAVGALFARAVLPLVSENHREVCARGVDFAERYGSGESIDHAAAGTAAARVANIAWPANNYGGPQGEWAARAAAWAARAAWAAADEFSDWTAADIAAGVADAADIASGYGPGGYVKLPSADDVRAILGPPEDWL